MEPNAAGNVVRLTGRRVTLHLRGAGWHEVEVRDHDTGENLRAQEVFVMVTVGGSTNALLKWPDGRAETAVVVDVTGPESMPEERADREHMEEARRVATEIAREALYRDGPGLIEEEAVRVIAAALEAAETRGYERARDEAYYAARDEEEKRSL